MSNPLHQRNNDMRMAGGFVGCSALPPFVRQSSRRLPALVQLRQTAVAIAQGGKSLRPAFFSEQLLRQTHLSQALDQLVGVGRISKGQSAKMLGLRVSRIDLLELAPNLAGLVGPAQMTQRRRQ